MSQKKNYLARSLSLLLALYCQHHAQYKVPVGLSFYDQGTIKWSNQIVVGLDTPIKNLKQQIKKKMAKSLPQIPNQLKLAYMSQRVGDIGFKYLKDHQLLWAFQPLSRERLSLFIYEAPPSFREELGSFLTSKKGTIWLLSLASCATFLVLIKKITRAICSVYQLRKKLILNIVHTTLLLFNPSTLLFLCLKRLCAVLFYSYWQY